jgi:hypothetical protein
MFIWLFAFLKINKDEFMSLVRLYELTPLICYGGHVHILKHLHQEGIFFDAGSSDAQQERVIQQSLLRVALKDRLEVAQLLHDLFDLTRLRPLINLIVVLQLSCECNSSRVATWLLSSFTFSPSDVRKQNNLCFRLSCENGNLELVTLLIDTFQLTCEDARAEDNYALRMSCANGHLGVAMLLVSRFSLCHADVSARFGHALRVSRSNGHDHVVAWIKETFP